MQFVIFIAFTLLVGIVAYLATRSTNEQSEDGYFLGGRSLTGPVIAASLLLTNLSTEQLVGLNGSAYNEGILVMAWETLAAIAMVVTALVLLPRYLKGGLTTIPQFLERRYDTMTKSYYFRAVFKRLCSSLASYCALFGCCCIDWNV
jgi:SSS family solute:Na+ symporter